MHANFIDDNINTNHVNVDIIVLGCSLPGMVTAHKLKKTFGDTMEIIVLDLVNKPKSFTKVVYDNGDDCDYKGTARDIADNLTKYYLTIFAKSFKIPIPKTITAPEEIDSNLSKVFENEKGDIEIYNTNIHELNFLNIFEQFELNQYQMVLDVNMKDLFQTNKFCNTAERKNLLYFDRTNMEQDICNSLLFPTSRNIMRNTVRLVCGVPPNKVSVLFFLYQCYRTGSVRNNLDKRNTKHREKLLGYFKKHISSKLYQSISNITLPTKPIKEISSYLGDKVILKTCRGDTDYICNHLAMALKPDELHTIQFESALLTENEKNVLISMTKGKSKKFWIQYKDQFWRRADYSGDIFSLRGPIEWATEIPNLPHTTRKELCPILIGYLKHSEENTDNSEEAVKRQLVGLFGDEAANSVRYIESEIDDIYVPLCGNFIALREILNGSNHKLEWGALDIFADGDVAAALEAGHNAYLHLLAFLRPQAQSYEDLKISSWPTFFNNTNPFQRWFSGVNFASSTRLALYATAAYVGYRVMRYLNN